MSSIPWIEKYRPYKLDQIIGNQTVVELFRVFAVEGNMPHLVITGTPGIGKTTIVNCLLNEVFQQDKQKKSNSVLELNASDERGVDVVRTKIKSFLQKKSSGERYLILDESDSMTNAAQQSMRRLMERHLDSRFIFICNDLSKIPDTIQSRGAIIRLAPLGNKELKEIITRVSSSEGLEIQPESIQLIAETSDGDARQAINFLQIVGSLNKVIDPLLVIQMTHVPPMETVHKIFAKETITIKDSLALLEELFTNGYTLDDISKMIFRVGREKNDRYLLELSSLLVLKLTESPSKIHFYSLAMSYYSDTMGSNRV
ncbi:replication factor C subunit 2/4 [Nematocida sp. AWRm80]|nr:replication factor C subunit 2/4 [Nematocida sp. AWRm80]